jgi:uncharacterized integral membrane protein
MADEDRDKRDGEIEQSRPSGPSTRTVAVLIIAVLVAVFILANLGSTRISFVFFHAEAPLWAALAIMAAGGFLAGFLVGRRRYHKR